MQFLSYLVALVGIFVLIAEFWTGIAIAGWNGASTVDRRENPAPYWFTMLLHTLAALIVPLLTFLM